jgi:hypothetical protein
MIVTNNNGHWIGFINTFFYNFCTLQQITLHILSLISVVVAWLQDSAMAIHLQIFHYLIPGNGF